MATSLLEGRTVVVTRGEGDGVRWVEELRQRGAVVLHRPCITTEYFNDEESARALAHALTGAAWIVFTSRHGVQAAAALWPRSLPAGVRLAVVGTATGEAAAEFFGPVDLVAPEGTGRSLALALLRKLPPEKCGRKPKIAIAAAEGGRRDLDQVIPAQRADIVHVAVYRTVPHPPLDPPEDLSRIDEPVVLLASPSAVAGLLNRARLPENARIVTIGPSTSEAARKAGLKIAGEARERTLESMLEVIP